jgi:hypothetical protein
MQSIRIKKWNQRKTPPIEVALVYQAKQFTSKWWVGVNLTINLSD